MSDPALIHSGRAFEDGGVSLMARVITGDGTNLVQADLSSITYDVRKVSDGTQVTSGTLTVATVVFDTLQTPSNVWTTDTTGYNFRYDAPAAELPDGDEQYQFEIKFTPTSGAAFYAVFRITTVPLLSS